MEPASAEALAILAGAVLLDRLGGEYPSPLHPVVWIGKTISLILRFAPRTGWWRQFLFGLLLAVCVPALTTTAALTSKELAGQDPILGIVVGALLLKASFAVRELGAAAERVRVPLVLGDVAAARESLRSLCSRDPSQLDEEALAAAAVQSLAENASDSFVAPFFYYMLFGVPGAIAYRTINTLDSMVGYRGRFEALGKASARLDDLVNWIPARITAVLLLLSGGLAGRDTAGGLRIYRRDRANTPSPNGGRPMAMMAGLLGVQLEKKGVYSLGDPKNPLEPATIRRAWTLVDLTSWLAVVGCAAGVCLLRSLAR